MTKNGIGIFQRDVIEELQLPLVITNSIANCFIIFRRLLREKSLPQLSKLSKIRSTIASERHWSLFYDKQTKIMIRGPQGVGLGV